MIRLGIRRNIRRVMHGYLDIGRRKHYDQGSFHKLAEARALSTFFERYRVDCVFDIGANAGQYAQALRSNAGYQGHIISVEPLPEIFGNLRALSASDDKWHVLNLGLSDSEGHKDFHVMRGSQFSSFLSPRNDEFDKLSVQNDVTSTISVKTNTLDTVFREWRDKLGFRRPFLKLDTQGYDHVILASGQEAARESVGIQVEVAFKRLYEGALDFSQTIAFLDQMGFSVSTMFPNNAGHFPDCIEQDVIFHNRSLPPEV